MALQSTTIININGTEVTNFKSLKLNQSINNHHTLEVVCRMDVLEDPDNELATNSKEFLGEIITVEIVAAEGFEGNHQDLSFKGVVTKIQTVKGHEVSFGDKIIITAQSPDMLSNDGPHYASYNDVSLSNIVNQTFEEYDTSKLEVDVRPQNDVTLHYSVQHNESAYAYASRLSAQYGEWLYYDGEKLIFGTPDDNEIELTYGLDLKEYQISLLPQSNNYKVFANDYLTDETQEKSTSETEAGLSGFGEFVSGKSSALYTKETKIWHNLYTDPEVQQRLDSATALQKKAIEIKQVKVHGTCDNPGLKLGSIIVIEGNRYRITSLSHSNNEIGNYINNFEGLTADINIYPLTNINAFPKSETQVATVKENADPESLGRIRVQFPWQEEQNELTPWIRIVTPHGGANKGFHFIPEIDEKVLVGFEGANAEHPYILGVLYTGNAKPEEFATETNDIKSIRTRSGHTIELNDTDGEEKISIYDNEGSIIIFDTQEKSLTINATENIDISAKNITITAEENITIGAQENVEIAAEGDLTAIAQGDLALQSTGDATINSNGAVAIEATSDATLSGTNAVISGQASAELSGAQAKVAGSAMAELSGGIVKIN